ncbi:MAG: hypothetical protein AB1648_14200 [Pseudomonadota bacterium]
MFTAIIQAKRALLRKDPRGGDSILEVDLPARYLERLIQGEAAARPAGSLTRELLRGNGFIA